MSLIIFGIHLGLLGYLNYRSGYIPKIIGILPNFSILNRKMSQYRGFALA